LVVDDNPVNVAFMEKILGSAGYWNIRSTHNSGSVTDIYLDFQPDLIILDLMMPQLDGFQVMEQLSAVCEDYLPILVLTGDKDKDTRLKALDAGAKDFVEKPFQVAEGLLRIKNMLEVRILYQEVEEQAQILKLKDIEKSEELENARKLQESILPSEGERSEFRVRLMS